jgi:signal transduction histidine kinase
VASKNARRTRGRRALAFFPPHNSLRSFDASHRIRFCVSGGRRSPFADHRLEQLRAPFNRGRTSGSPLSGTEDGVAGRLTGGVAHDFNNLLTVVLGNAAALRVNAEARGDAEAIRRAEMIERAAERGGRLAAQLLAYSRKQMLRPETISVYQIISATTELLAQAAGEAVRIRLQTQPELWKCHVDPGQLESAILNLVLNARDAMPHGGSITIHCYNHAVRRGQTGTPARAAGDYVRVDVNDTGCGIAPDLLDKVFEPFFTTKPLAQGSGLGLSQVHGFAGQSGGWVDLESSLGSGTTVSLFLPRDSVRPLRRPNRTIRRLLGRTRLCLSSNLIPT